MERAVALRKIYLYGKEQCERCDLLNKQTPSSTRLTSPNNEEDNNLIRKQLISRLPSSSIEIIMEWHGSSFNSIRCNHKGLLAANDTPTRDFPCLVFRTWTLWCSCVFSSYLYSSICVCWGHVSISQKLRHLRSQGLSRGTCQQKAFWSLYSIRVGVSRMVTRPDCMSYLLMWRAARPTVRIYFCK
jgi:hypothetical protein